MPCSRTPQWKVRPVVVGPNVPPCLSVVPVLPPRSAEPPTRLGTAAAIACSARPEACRVASGPLSGVSAGSACVPAVGQRAREPLVQLARGLGVVRGVRREPGPPLGLERRAAAAPPRASGPARPPGTKNVGSSGQPMISLVRRTSSAPSGSPWAFGGVALGRRRIGDVGAQDDQRRARGLGDAPPRSAAAMAREVVAVAHADHVPAVAPRSGAGTSSLNESAVSPSMVMWLSS